MENWELNLIEARSLLLNSLSSHIFSEVIDLEGGFLKFIFNNGTILFVTYNKVAEYSYQYIYSYKKYDRERYDNYDKHWNVKTRPHHFHPRYKKEGNESPMNGIPDHDIPVLVKFIKEKINF